MSRLWKIGSKCLGRETLATTIQCRNLETIVNALFRFKVERRCIHYGSIVESHTVLRCIYYIRCRYGCRFLLVLLCYPRQSQPSRWISLYAEIAYWQRLNHRRNRMISVNKAEYGLIKRTRKRKAKIRIQTAPHISKVLVRHGLDDGWRHLRLSGLAIVAVPKVASCPLTIFTAYVTLQTCQQRIGKVVRNHSRNSTIQSSVIKGSSADGKGAYYRVINCRISSVAMHSQTKFDRHFLTFQRRYVRRTTCQPVGHVRADIYVVAIIVTSILWAVNAVRSTSPLGAVTCSFQASWHTAAAAATLYVTHSATESNGVRGHHSWLRRRIGNHHSIKFVVSTVKIKCTKIHPSTATHLLVNLEDGALPLVHNNILCIWHAVLQRLIAYINSILAALRYIRLIRSPRNIRLFCCLHSTCCSLRERILPITICSGMICKAILLCGLPCLLSTVLHIASTTIIHDYLVLLPVAFTWRKNHSTRILQHRYKIRYYDGLGEKILCCAEKIGALPFPSILLPVVIASVTCP